MSMLEALLKNENDLRKALRKASKYNFEHTEFVPKQRFHGSDMTSGINYWVFKKRLGVTVESVMWVLSSLGFDLEQRRSDSPYDCSGQLLLGSAVVKESKTRILVTQWWGYDI
jgi:hypothetical protein